MHPDGSTIFPPDSANSLIIKINLQNHQTSRIYEFWDQIIEIYVEGLTSSESTLKFQGLMVILKKAKQVISPDTKKFAREKWHFHLRT